MAVAVALLVLLQGPGARSAEPTKPSPSACGANTHEAVSIAETALAAQSATADRHALICLVAAIKAMEAERLDIIRGNDKAHMLRVPRNP